MTEKLQIALMNSQDVATTALMSAQELPEVEAAADVPEWIHLLPAPVGGKVSTNDSRGPYVVESMQSIIDDSFRRDSRLPIDENHSIDLAAPRGEPAPARGWIVAMEAREDGVWGKVEWNAVGRRLVATKAYRGISPVILHNAAMQVKTILRASLVNKPNLSGMTALHQQEEPAAMDWKKFLIEMLGLGADASEDDIKKALNGMKSKGKESKDGNPVLNSEQFASLTAVFDLEATATPDQLIEAAQASAAAGDATPDEITALQGEVTSLTTKLNALQDDGKRARAETYIDGEIKNGRVGLKPVRARYIALHMKDEAEAKELVEALPILGDTPTSIQPPQGDGATVSLNAAEVEVATRLGMTAEEYSDHKKTLEA